jgi:hypothetical protein
VPPTRIAAAASLLRRPLIRVRCSRLRLREPEPPPDDEIEAVELREGEPSRSMT